MGIQRDMEALRGSVCVLWGPLWVSGSPHWELGVPRGQSPQRCLHGVPVGVLRVPWGPVALWGGGYKAL